MSDAPKYLADYASDWDINPKSASIKWWQEAKFGLFIHYGLYSQLAEGEWVQFRRPIPVSEYEQLAESFDPSKFDADFITDLALEAEMRYVNLVTCHHDSFALWDSKSEPFNSMKAASRDLVAELSKACDKKRLGFFTYYTYHANWRHPYFLSRDYYAMARPDYSTPEPRYKLTRDEDFQKYVEYAHACITELMTGYGPIAGMWLDLISGYYAAPDMMPVEETYKLVRSLQPQTLISFKQGATGTEDFASPERHFQSLEERIRSQYGDRAGDIAAKAWNANKGKHNEICATLQGHRWAYAKTERHLNTQEVRGLLGHALSHNANLLLNTGPLPDGSIPDVDVQTLKEVGRSIRDSGWPGGDEAAIPGEDPTRKAGAAGQ